MSSVEKPIRIEGSKLPGGTNVWAAPPAGPHAAASSRVYDELARLVEFMPQRYREVFSFRWGLGDQFPHLASEVVRKFELPKTTVDAMLSRCLWNVARHAHLHELAALHEMLGEDRERWAERAWAHAQRRWGDQGAAGSEAVLLLSVAGLDVREAQRVARQHLVHIGLLEQDNRWGRSLSDREQVEVSRQAVDRMVGQAIWPASSAKLPDLGAFRVRRPLPAWTPSKCGVFLSRKLDRLVQFDSELELVIILRALDVDPRVVEYQAQPVTIPYVLDGEAHEYTPDVIVRLADGRAFIIEAKPPVGLGDFTNWMKWASLACWCEGAGVGFWIGSPQRSITEHRCGQPDPELRKFVADEVQAGAVTGRDYTALRSLVGAEQLGLITTAELLDCRVLPGRLRQAQGPDRHEARQLWELIDRHSGARPPATPLGAQTTRDTPEQADPIDCPHRPDGGAHAPDTGGSLRGVRAVVRDPPPPEFEALLERRRRLRWDVLDEVWEAVYVVRQVPAGWHADIAQQLAVLFGPLAREAGLAPMISGFNLGASDDYRVPDGGLFRSLPDQLYVPTADLVVEIVSAGDGTWDKLGFYAAHDVTELLIIEPPSHEIHWLALRSDRAYHPTHRSALVALGQAELAEHIDWPL